MQKREERASQKKNKKCFHICSIASQGAREREREREERGQRRGENGRLKTNELSRFIIKLAYKEPRGSEARRRNGKV